MTPKEFRQLALSLPEAVEGAHMGHADFRIEGKIFATLGYPDDEWGMVKLPREEQQRLNKKHPDTFVPAKGNWGEQGSTQVHLAKMDEATLTPALKLAWQTAAPKLLTQKAILPKKP